MSDEFYIGWMDRAPKALGKFHRKTVTVLLSGIFGVAMIVALAQRHYTGAAFEWGETHTFSGILHTQPLPYLQLDSDPKWTEGFGTSAALVAPFKWGIPAANLAQWDGKHVELTATRIHQENQLMLECVPESIRETTATKPTMASSHIALGTQKLVGEIVDGKCWMGVMNPGALKPHKACAVRCISGGIPPMLVIRRQNDFPLNLFLVPRDPSHFPENLLDYVAEPVELEGEIVVHDGLVLLQYDPDHIRRWNPLMTAQARERTDPVCGLH